MPALGWGKSTDVLNAIQDCMIRRLTIDESLQYLESRGHKMSESKLLRIKRHLRESTQDRLNYIAYHEYAQSHLDSIDTIKSVITRLWEIVNENKGEKEEIKALELIPQNIKILEELYDGNPIVATLASKLAEKVK
ncbi:MAG: hypothetical protein ACREAK_04160, partial [Nitrosarchaeum sp.]